MTFNRPVNHAYSLEISKLIALIHVTELPLVNEHLVPFVITVKGNEICKLKTDQKSLFAHAFPHQNDCFNIDGTRILPASLLEALSGLGHGK